MSRTVVAAPERTRRSRGRRHARTTEPSVRARRDGRRTPDRSPGRLQRGERRIVGPHRNHHARHLLVRPARQPGGGRRLQPHTPQHPGRLPADPLRRPGRLRQAQQRRPGGQRARRGHHRVPAGPGVRDRRGGTRHHRPGERRPAPQAAAAGARPDHLRGPRLRRAAGRRADGHALPRRPVRPLRARRRAHLGGVRRAGRDRPPQGTGPAPGALPHRRHDADGLLRLAGGRPVVRHLRRSLERLPRRRAVQTDRGVLAAAHRPGPRVRERGREPAVRRADRQRAGPHPAQRRLGRRRADERAARAEGPVADRAHAAVGHGTSGDGHARRFHVRGHQGQPEPRGRHGVHRVAGLHPDALRARLSSGTSSQYPAAPGLVRVDARPSTGRTTADRTSTACSSRRPGRSANSGCGDRG
ncbi:hypothetical protein SPARM206S_00821 [Streptomyces parvulus]